MERTFQMAGGTSNKEVEGAAAAPDCCAYGYILTQTKHLMNIFVPGLEHGRQRLVGSMRDHSIVVTNPENCKVVLIVLQYVILKGRSTKVVT